MSEQILLTRDQFRELVFDRDRSKCVICSATGKDVHHIMERKLFPDGGYYLDNGATLCADCHLRAEQTTITVEEIKAACGISRNTLPPHLYENQPYDKWGNPILPNGTRLKGELFDDPGVRQALSKVLGLFISRVKYPRTYHFPFSPGAKNDDRIMETYAGFKGKEIVVTEKMDGENTSWYRDGMHARSLEYEDHPSRHLVKALWGEKRFDIPDNYRICGENLYAKHSIHYTNLHSYFQIFGIWNGLTCLSWEDTVIWVGLLGLRTVPIIYSGLWDEELIMNIALSLNTDKQEGLVVRLADSIHMKAWPTLVGKYVRDGHIQTDQHWMKQEVIPNRLGEV